MMRRLLQRFAPAVLLVAALGAERGAAQTCSISVSTLNFGTPNTGVQTNGTATGRVTCGGGWSVVMNTGAGNGATETIRYMTAPSGVELAYRLFTDAARTNNWDTTTGHVLTGTGNTNINVYGQITAGQSVPSGTYTDTMTTAKTSFTVTAVITATCSISATNLNFGNYAGALVNGTSTVTVNCTNQAPFDIGLNAGNGSGATVTGRKMTGPGGALLNYALYRNSGRSLNWGITVGTDTLHATGTGSAVQYTVYGQITAGQFPRPGTYSDTIVATVTY